MLESRSPDQVCSLSSLSMLTSSKWTERTSFSPLFCLSMATDGRMGSVEPKTWKKREPGGSRPSRVSRGKLPKIGDRLPDLFIGHFEDGGHRQSSVDPFPESDGEEELAIWKGGDGISCQVCWWCDEGSPGRPVTLARIAVAVCAVSQKETLPLL